jgi:hypothetical protein
MVVGWLDVPLRRNDEISISSAAPIRSSCAGIQPLTSRASPSTERAVIAARAGATMNTRTTTKAAASIPVPTVSAAEMR